MEELRLRIAAPPTGFQVPPLPSSLPPSPLFPSLSIGAAGACGVPARAIPPRFPARARLALPFPCARLAPAPSHASFPAVFLASARLPARRGVRRTPWRRLSSRGDAIRQKVMAGWTPRFRNRPDDKATPRRRHGDAIKTMEDTKNFSFYETHIGFHIFPSLKPSNIFLLMLSLK